tara:strand:- start:444 stop:1532 length:1089 start_codon:yes stop_codon:yes gene_type:complete
MKNTGEVIAERSLVGANETVTIQIYAPFDNGSEFKCDYQIMSSTHTFRDTSPGCAADVALLGATLGLRFHLVEEGFGEDLMFPGGLPNATGFEPYHCDPDLNALLEARANIEAVSSSMLFDAMTPVAGIPDATNDAVQLAGEAVRLQQVIQQRIVALPKDSSSPLLLERHLLVEVIDMPPAGPTVFMTRCFRKDTGGEVAIQVFKPCLRGKTVELGWICKYQITGLDKPICAGSLGADSMAALIGVFEAIARDLEGSTLARVYEEGDGLCSDSLGGSGFERFGLPPQSSVLMGHFVASEVLRNKIFYKQLCAGPSADVADLEASLLARVEAIERMRYWIRRLDIGRTMEPEAGEWRLGQSLL